jgi:lysophospholipase L1-like esterase
MSRLGRTATAASVCAIAAGAALGGQAVYTTRRRDLPSVTGCNASGSEGDDRHPRLRVVALGDSTLTGPGLGHASDVWLRQALRELAAARQCSFDLLSYAVGGARVKHVARQQVQWLIDARPDLVVIVVGTNDAIHFIPLRSVRRHFDDLLEQCAALSPQVVIGGVGDLAQIARLDWPLAGLIRRRGHQVNRVIRAAAAAYPNVHFVDVSRADPHFRRGGRALFSADLFHPNRDGHRLWADVALPVIDRALPRV